MVPFTRKIFYKQEINKVVQHINTFAYPKLLLVRFRLMLLPISNPFLLPSNVAFVHRFPHLLGQSSSTSTSSKGHIDSDMIHGTLHLVEILYGETIKNTCIHLWLNREPNPSYQMTVGFAHWKRKISFQFAAIQHLIKRTENLSNSDRTRLTFPTKKITQASIIALLYPIFSIHLNLYMKRKPKKNLLSQRSMK